MNQHGHKCLSHFVYMGLDVDVNFLLMFEASIGQGQFTYKLDCNVISGLDICTYEQT